VALYGREPVIVEEDCAGQDPEVMSSDDDHGPELEINHWHPQHDAGNVQPETVCNVPPQTRSRTHCASFRYPSPVCPSDDEVGVLLHDSYGVPMRPGRTLVTARSKLLGPRGTSPTRGW
jgi:hypothetical protein